jgi:hypothetical protein
VLDVKYWIPLNRIWEGGFGKAKACHIGSHSILSKDKTFLGGRSEYFQSLNQSGDGNDGSDASEGGY